MGGQGRGAGRGGQPQVRAKPDPWPGLASGYHGSSYSPDGVEPVSPVSSPSLAHDKGLPKHLEELDKGHLEGDLRHKQPGSPPPRALAPTLTIALKDRDRCHPRTQTGRLRCPEAESPACASPAPPPDQLCLAHRLCEAHRGGHAPPTPATAAREPALQPAAPGHPGGQRSPAGRHPGSAYQCNYPTLHPHLCIWGGTRLRGWGGEGGLATRSPSVWWGN